MILIYSDKQTKIKGKHIDPEKFSGMPCNEAKEVYADDEKIKSIYEKIGKVVSPLPKVEKLKEEKKETEKPKKDKE